MRRRIASGCKRKYGWTPAQHAGDRTPTSARPNTASPRVATRAGLVRAAHLDLAGEDSLDGIYAKNLRH